MTKSNKPHNKTNADIDMNAEADIAAEQTLKTAQINSPQVTIKSWSQKLLVVLLCLASFYGGWKSYESNMVNECSANGGQMIDGQRTLICQSL